MFMNLQSDLIMKPLPKFETPESIKKYPPIRVADQITEELKLNHFFRDHSSIKFAVDSP